MQRNIIKFQYYSGVCHNPGCAFSRLILEKQIDECKSII